MPTTPPPRILVVDDHPLYAEAMALVLAPLSEAVTLAASLESARVVVAAETFDLVLCDLDLVDGSGLELIRELRVSSPATPVVVISTAANPRVIKEAIAAGVSGYLRKSLDTDELRAGVAAALSGAPTFDQAATRVLVSSFQNQDEALTLSQRELDVIRLAAQGCTNRQIAEILMISPNTVKDRTRSAYVKLDAQDRASAVAAAFRLGLLEA